MARSVTRSTYDIVPFHAVRASSFISASIVTGILVFFLVQLRASGFKIPWAILGVSLAAMLSLINLLLTSLFFCCGKLSPLFSMIVNIPILIIWALAFSLFSSNIVGVLGHSCSIDDWGNQDGVRVCSIYKTLYSFMLFATLSQIAQVVLDVRARREQNKMGKYAKMMDTSDIKMETSTRGIEDNNPRIETYLQEQRSNEIPGWRPGADQIRPLQHIRAVSGSSSAAPAYQHAQYGQYPFTNTSTSTYRYADSNNAVRANGFDFGLDSRPNTTANNPGSYYYADNADRRY